MVDQQLDAIDVLRKSDKSYKKLLLRLIMQCILASHKLYKKTGGGHKFLIFMLDLCTQLLQNTPRLQNPVRRPGEDNIIRLTGRNHWPGRRDAPDWNQMKSRTEICRVCLAKERRTQAGNPIKMAWICKGYPGNPGLCVD